MMREIAQFVSLGNEGWKSVAVPKSAEKLLHLSLKIHCPTHRQPSISNAIIPQIGTHHESDGAVRE